MRRLVGAAVLVLGSCAGDQASRPGSRTPLFQTGRDGDGVQSPALWRYHPTAAAPMNVRAPIDADTTLYAGARGERWLASQKLRSVTAAARLAPEELIAAQRAPSGGWSFLGASGTTYQSKTPLGPFVRSSAPLERLVRVSASSTSLLGVKRDGSLARSADSGATWQGVGPKAQLFVDVAVAGDGRGLALAVPEALWLTRDHGQTWQAAGVTPVGALSLGLDARDALLVNGVLGLHRFTPAARLEPIAEAAARRRHALPFAPERGPDAGAIAQGRAVRLGERYAEVGSSSDGRGGLRLLEGSVSGALRTLAVPALSGCRDARITAFEQSVVLACLSGADPAVQRVSFFRRVDERWSFQREPFEATANAALFRMAVGRDALIVTGICPTHESARGCLPRGVHYRRPRLKREVVLGPGAAGKPSEARGAYELSPAATPALGFTAAALAFSSDGRTAYAIGRRSKAGEYGLFVSRDGGQTFTPRLLEDLPSEYAALPGAAGRGRRSLQDPVAAELGPADDGSLALVLTLNAKSLLVVADSDGRVVSVSNPPGDNALIGAYGSRALAVSVASRQAWETLDGGASWQNVGRLPADPCPGDANCSLPVVCGPAGCVVGHELSRQGWGGQGDDDAGLLSPPEAAQLGTAVERRLRTPLSCALEPTAWKDLPGVAAAPTADQAMLGKVQWFAMTSDDATAAAGILHGYGGGRPRVETVPLLAPVARPSRFATHATMQVEGVAALRYLTPESKPGETELRDVELAWNNLFEDRVVRTRVANAGPYRPGDYERGDGLTQRARPALLSISSGGLYARVHGAGAAEQPTLFVDAGGVRVVPPVAWPKNVVDRSHREMTQIARAHVPVAFFGAGAAIVRGRSSGTGWTFDALTTGLDRPKDFDLTQYHDLTYVGTTPALHVLLYANAGQWRRGYVFPFRADGAAVDPPIAVPAQYDGADPPSACGEAAAKTPRVVVPYQAGTRHAVVVSDAAEPLRLLVTGSAVMRGTPERPCMAALDAELVKTDVGAEPQSETAILPLSDLEHAWLFRVARTADNQRATLQYRSMSCRFDAKTEVPPEAFRVPGVTVTLDPRH